MGKNFMRIFMLVFGLTGLILLTVAFFLFRSEISFRTDALRAPGVVVDLVPSSGSRGGTLYKTVFVFADNKDRKHRITGNVASSPPAHNPGEAVTVLYKPGEPENAQLDSFMSSWFAPLLVGGLGIVFTSVSAGILISALRRRSMLTRLAAGGTQIQARVDGTYLDAGIQMNGRSPYRITAQWQNPLDQKVYVFRSDPIWFDPKPFMHADTVNVTINADNPHQYEMDISFLPEAG